MVIAEEFGTLINSSVWFVKKNECDVNQALIIINYCNQPFLNPKHVKLMKNVYVICITISIIIIIYL